ncbi:hypothetical protein [Rhizobium anhuiense]|uniref:hypothetical protein n=1 Tax=Rhizobium anhuiense TaxID=1184720 RepID=UPI000A4BCD2E|nr:hypothetical protein [Rhizobium anhuiense]
MSEYVFNSVSNDGANGGLHATKSLVVTFVETLAELDTRLTGPARPLKLPSDPWELNITTDDDGEIISLGEVINSFYEDGQTRELATFFDALQCYAPAVEQLDGNAIDAILRLSADKPVQDYESVFEAVCDAGFEAMQCVVTGGVLVSLNHGKWNFSHALFECSGMAVALDHASHPLHVDDLLKRAVADARSRLTRQNFDAIRSTAFPSLIWGQDVSGQFEKFPAEYIRLAFSRLANLDDMASRWKSTGDGEPDPGSMVLRNESDLTMQNYGGDRRFRSAAGTIKTFERHVWIDKGNRIHFLLDHVNRTVEIGYVGTHLPTWNF